MKIFKILLIICFLTTIVFAKPIADFTFNPISGDAPITVDFDARNSIDAEFYSWEIDGVAKAAGPILTFDFGPGEHEVTLVVIDTDDQTDEITKILFFDAGEYNTNLEVNCPVLDESGLYEFKAKAYEDGFCHETNVYVYLEGYKYILDKNIDCSYSKLMKLPVGDYNVEYKAVYSDSERNAICILSVDEGDDAFIKVYSPQENTIFKKDSVAYVEAVFIFGVKNIREGVGLVKLVDSNGTVYSESELSIYYPGAFKGEIPISASEGDYELLVEIKYKDFDLIKVIPISVSESQSEDLISIGPNIYLVEPGIFNYLVNDTVPFEVNFFDENGLILADANSTMNVYKYGDFITSVEMNVGRFSYEISFVFNESGDYEVEFVLEKDNKKAIKNIIITVGNATQLAEVENFTVKFITPMSDVYADDSELIIRVLVDYNKVRVSGAGVVLTLNGEEFDMEYDKFGEYIHITEPLASGSYNAKVVANYLDLVAGAEVVFQASSHHLVIKIIEPDFNETVEITKGKSLNLKVDILDEFGDIVPDALVIAEIIEPSGRTLKEQLIQNEETKIYEAIIYPNDEGLYRIDFIASDLGFVSASEESEFKISFTKIDYEMPGITLDNLLIIALIIAILIMIVFFLKMVF